MKIQHLLGGLLAFQLLLAGGLFAHHRQQQAQLAQQTEILSFDKSAVDKIEIADKSGKVVLTKASGAWTVPDYSGLPADPEKVDELLTDLSTLKGGWPVSTVADSHEQFEVAEKKFAKTVKLMAGEKLLAELYLGTSPGLRNTHVRNAKDKNVYSVALSSTELAVANDQWFDRSIFAMKDPTEIKGKDFALKKSGSAWNLEGAGAADKAAVDNLLKALTNLQVEALQSTAPSGAATTTLEVVDGKPLTLSFWVKGDAVTVRRSDNDKAFTMGKPIYAQLISFDKAKLTSKKESAPAAATPAATP